MLPVTRAEWLDRLRTAAPEVRAAVVREVFAAQFRKRRRRMLAWSW